MKIAFDVDDTLIVPANINKFKTDTPNYETIAIFKWFEKQGYEMVIWSGGGVDYAKMWADKLGLKAEILPKTATFDVGIAFDDCDVELGKVNVKVKRIDNSINRKKLKEYQDNEKELL